MRPIQEIVQACLQNERKAQFELYDHCFDAMLSVCRRYERNEEFAIEIVNMAFIKVLKNLSKYQPNKPFTPWVCRIAVNQSIDRYRQKAKERELFDAIEEKAHLSDISVSTYSEVEWENEEYLQSLLEHLSESEKTVFNLFAIDGYKHKEIATQLGITERSSIRHLTNARNKLQQLIEEKQMRIKKA